MYSIIELQERLSYCPITGHFIHRLTHRNVKKGNKAGHKDDSRGGYIRIHIGNSQYTGAHRLAYVFMTGAWPVHEIDHIDHNPTNNAWSNLRIVTHAVNGKNQKKYISNTSGVTGIHLRSNGKYRARIYHAGKHISLGTFEHFNDAVVARKQADIKYNFHPNHGAIYEG